MTRPAELPAIAALLAGQDPASALDRILALLEADPLEARPALPVESRAALVRQASLLLAYEAHRIEEAERGRPSPEPVQWLSRALLHQQALLVAGGLQRRYRSGLPAYPAPERRTSADGQLSRPRDRDRAPNLARTFQAILARIETRIEQGGRSTAQKPEPIP